MGHDPGCAVWRDEWPLDFYGKAVAVGAAETTSLSPCDNAHQSAAPTKQQQLAMVVGVGSVGFLPNWSAKVEYNFLGLATGH